MVRLKLNNHTIWPILNRYFIEHKGLSDGKFIDQFETTYRCTVIEIDGFYEIEFTDENYTWFVLKWGYHDQ
jgi:hypothetical protein